MTSVEIMTGRPESGGYERQHPRDERRQLPSQPEPHQSRQGQRLTRSAHPIPRERSIRRVADFCAALWPEFTPPLTRARSRTEGDPAPQGTCSWRRSLLRQSRMCVLPGTEGTSLCNYGRSCGTLRAGGRDVGSILKDEGLAVAFVCGRTSCPPTPRPWCS